MKNLEDKSLWCLLIFILCKEKNIETWFEELFQWFGA